MSATRFEPDFDGGETDTDDQEEADDELEAEDDEEGEDEDNDWFNSIIGPVFFYFPSDQLPDYHPV